MPIPPSQLFVCSLFSSSSQLVTQSSWLRRYEKLKKEFSDADPSVKRLRSALANNSAFWREGKKCSDLNIYLRNNNDIAAACCAHRLNPYSRSERRSILSMGLLILISMVIIDRYIRANVSFFLVASTKRNEFLVCR